jgi:hypothetical protein
MDCDVFYDAAQTIALLGGRAGFGRSDKKKPLRLSPEGLRKDHPTTS